MHLGWRDFTERRKLKQIVLDTFFSRKEDIEKDLISYKEIMSRIDSFAAANVDAFINDKIIFDMEENNDRIKYNRYVDLYLELLGAFESLKHSLEDIGFRYEFAKMVESMIEKNMFLINFKNESFTDEFLVAYSELFGVFEKRYNSITCSFGVIEVEPNADIHNALQQADESLYKAKATGRNKVVAEQLSL